MAPLQYKQILMIGSCILVLMAITFDGVECGHSTIRIHVPIKHHTHIHTKTIVKTVHVPVKPSPKTHYHHHYVDHDDLHNDDIASGWSKSFNKRKKSKPKKPAVFY